VSKLEQREEALRGIAKNFASLMEHDEKLRGLIEAADADPNDENIEAVVQCVHEFQEQAIYIIGGLAIVTARIDNSSAAMFMGGIAGRMVETEAECDPLTLLRGMLGQ